MPVRLTDHHSANPLDVTEVTCPAWMLDASHRLRKLLLALSHEFLVNPHDIISVSMHKSASLPRQVGYWVLAETTRLSHRSIAERFRRYNHTTIGHGIKLVQRKRANDPKFKAQTDAVLDQFKAEHIQFKMAT